MDENRDEITAELRAETRDERMLACMVAIVEGETAMDRYAQMHDCDDFEDIARDALELAIDTESLMDESGGETPATKKAAALSRSMAESVIDDAVDEYLPGAMPPKEA